MKTETGQTYRGEDYGLILMPKTRRTEPAELKGFRIEWGSYYGDILSFGEFNGHEGLDIRWMDGKKCELNMARNPQIVNCRNVILNVVKNLLKSKQKIH